MSEDLTQLVAAHYPLVATDLLNPLLDLLQLARDHCGGDVDKFMILLVVGLRTTEHAEFVTRRPEQLMSGELPVFPGFGTNGRSIAESLGMPKETVRRKVRELIAAGWIAREGPSLFFTARAYQELAPVREGIERLAAGYFEVVARLREKAPPAGP